MTLMNYDPWQELAEMRRVFNRMFSEGFAQLPTERQAAQSGLFMPVDIAETSEEFVVTAELPGTNPDDIEITLSDNQVTIKGQRACRARGEAWQLPSHGKALRQFLQKLRTLFACR